MSGLREKFQDGWRKLVARLPGKSPGGKKLPPRVKTPTRLQMEVAECGAASLGIVLGYFGRWVALEELRLACGVSRDGSKASNLLKAARSYGLKAKGGKTEPSGLRRLKPPMIIHWNFNHFLVVEGFRGNKVYLNDPATGPRVVDDDEVDASFTGVVLFFEKGPDFVESQDKPSFLLALLNRLRGTRAALVFVVLAGFALVLPTLVSPVFSKIFIDNILLKGNQAWLNPLLFGMAATAAVAGLLTWLQQSYLLRLETRIALADSGRFLWHVLCLPMQFFSQRYTGEIAGRVGLNNRVAQLLSRDVATSVLGVVMAFLFLGLMLRYDVLLTVIGVLVVSLNIAALQFVSRRRKDGNIRLLNEVGKLHGVTVGGLQVIETLKATGGEADLFDRWAGHQAKVVNVRQDLEKYSQVLGVVPSFLGAANTALLLGIGSLRVMQGALTLGELVAFQALMVSFLAPVGQLVNLGSKLQTVDGDMGRLDDVLRYPAETEEGDETEVARSAASRLAGSLELRDVVFGYSPLDPPLLQNFNLKLRPGQRVALVGASGSGKSTLAKLVTGLFKPWQGEILFDGLPRDEVPRALLNASLATVDQSIFLFEGTVRENLTLWDSTIPAAEVVQAARDAAIHDEIAARSGGYDSIVEENGRNWSGGQRQRLEIARALVGRPSIFILDEATSALDPTTEAEIDASLRRSGATCLIVAHRLSTIRDADEIIVLEKGSVVERGTHEELLALGGTYTKLIGTY